MPEKEMPGRQAARPGSKTEHSNNTKESALKQVLSGDRDGFKTYDEALIQSLVALSQNDPVEFVRRKPEAAKQLKIKNPADLDWLIRECKQPQKQDDVQDFRLIKACDLTVKAPEWLIHGLIEDNTLGQMFGDSESGKTFLALDFALCVATGTPFHGKKIKQGPVVYIIGEGKNGFSRRCLAWSINKGIDYHDTPFFISTIPAAFLYQESTEQVFSAIAKVKPVLIVVDTLARNFGPGDENSTSDMNKFIAALDYIRRPYNATMLIIHHTGHGEKERSRGAYTLKCGLDFEYRVARNPAGIVVLESKKMKDAEKPDPMAFETQVVKMIDNDGKPMSSLAFELTDMPVGGTAQKSLSTSQRIALEALTGLLADKQSVHIDEWRAECYAAGISDGVAANAKRMAFKRAREALLDLGRICTRDDKYWIESHESQTVTL